MAKSIVCSACVDPSISVANTTQYWNIYGYVDRSTNSSFMTQSVYQEGDISNFQIILKTNTVSDTTVFDLMINDVAWGQTLSVPTNTSGTFEDTVTDNVNWGDDLVVRSVPGAGSTGTFQPTYMSVILTPTDTTKAISHFSCSHPSGRSSLTGASTVYYIGINGYIDTANTTEANVQHKIKTDGVITGFQAWVASNSRTTTTTARIRKNTANLGTFAISVGNQASGWFGDESNTSSVAVDDLINYSVTNGTGTAAISWQRLVCALVTESSAKLSTYIGFNQLAPTQARNISRYYPFCGYYDQQTTESYAQYKIPFGSWNAKNLNINLRANGISTASTFALRKNGSTTTLSVSITASTAGWFQDVTHTEALVEDDLIDYILTTGTGSGSQTLAPSSYGIVFEDTYTPPSVEATPNGKDIINNKVLIKV